MLMTIPVVSLVLAAALALVNLWLTVRVGQVRGKEKVSIGDGGNERVIRRMRAHANFGENAWVVLALVLVIELSVGSSLWLWAAAGIFVLSRILHGRGMDGWSFGRMSGTLVTMLLQLALAIWAVAIPLSQRAAAPADMIELAPARG
jgi:uncharacterized protein